MVLLHCGIFHSNVVSGLSVVRGRLISTLLPVAFTYPMSTSPASAVDPEPGRGPAAGVEREVIGTVEPTRRHDPAVLVGEVALLRPRVGVLVPRVTPIDRVPERVARHEHLLTFPVVVVRRAEEDPHAEVDVDEVGGDELPVDDDAGRDVHAPAPVAHVVVAEVAVVRVLERAPAAEQHSTLAHLLVARQRLVEEVEEVVVHRHDPLHELDVAHQAGQVVGEHLQRPRRTDAARVERGGVDVAALHEAEHLARRAAHLERLAVELALERVQRPHDVADGAVPVLTGMRRFGAVRRARARRGWSRRPSSRRSRPRPGSPGRCCGRTCTRRPRRG